MRIEQLFAILKDGTWHSIQEVANQVNVQPEKLTELAKYLLEKHIVKYEAETRKMMIEPEWRSLIPRVSEKPLRKRRNLKS